MKSILKGMASSFNRRFRRVTTAGNYIPEVDGVRCLAILMVIAQHLHERVLRRYPGGEASVVDTLGHRLLSEGGKGVMIFFALSGFILYQLLSRPILTGQSIKLGAYFWRRVTRLEPPYIIITTAIMTFVTLTGYQSGGKFLGKGDHSIWASYLATIFYLHSLIFRSPPSFNPPGWSLEIEVQFYILAPVLTLALLRLPRAWWRFSATLGVIAIWPSLMLSVLGPAAVARFETSLIGCFPFFLAGVLVCELMRATPTFPRWMAIWADVFAVLALAKLVGLIPTHLPIPGPLLSPTLLLFILFGAFRGWMVKALLSQPTVATVGGMCYTIYLVHVPVLELVCGRTVPRFAGLPYWNLLAVEAVVAIPVVFGVSAIAFLLIEQPCMRKTWPMDLWNAIRRRFSADPAALTKTAN